MAKAVRRRRYVAVNLKIGNSLLSSLAILRRLAYRIEKGLRYIVQFPWRMGVEFKLIACKAWFRPVGPGIW